MREPSRKESRDAPPGALERRRGCPRGARRRELISGGHLTDLTFVVYRSTISLHDHVIMIEVRGNDNDSCLANALVFDSARDINNDLPGLCGADFS
jgi:hypothetical protein